MSFERVEIGEHVLYRGDCLEVLPTLTSDSVELVVTSPPYNLKKKWWDSGANGIHVELASKFEDDWYDDEIPEPEYQQQQKTLLNECRRVSRGSVCYNHKVRHAFKRAGRTFHPIEWTGAADLWCEIIWDRGPGPAVNCRRPTMADERIFVFGKPVTWRNMGFTSVWKFPPNREQLGHPCPFPVELPRRLISSFTQTGHQVVDPYMGVGTTIVASAQLGRRGIGIESSREYFDIACRRIDDANGRGSLFEAVADVPATLFDE